MESLSDLRPFKFDYADLPGVVYYFWMSKYVLANFKSDDYSIEVKLDNSGFGPHWGGMFVELKDNEGNKKALCHAGLVCHPNTEIGICFEIDRFFNTENYQKIWDGINPAPGFDLNKNEPDYLKLFFPKDQLDDIMNSANVDKQISMLIKYFNVCFSAIFKAAN